MTRSVWKGPFVHPSLLKKIDKLKNSPNKKPIKTWSRHSTIIPDFVGHSFMIHNGKTFIPKKTDQIKCDDKIYAIINSNQMEETLNAFGHEEKISKKILIIGGGNIGYNLAKNLEESLDSVRIKIVEKNK